MKYNIFPNTQEKVSAIGLGTWVFGGENWGGADDAQCAAAVGEALASGMNLIDTAPFYTDGLSEKIIGQALKGRRDKAFIATKCGIIRENGRIRHDLRPASIMAECDQSLKRLQCDVIDLYICHWPDPAVAIEQTMGTLLKLRDQKKIRHIGVSNFDLELLKKACAAAPVSAYQGQYSILERGMEKEILPFCREKGIGVMAYGAMGGGILTGKYKNRPPLTKKDARHMFYEFFEEIRFKKVIQGVEDLKKMGHPMNQLALNWVRQQSGVMTALAGCRSAEQVRANVAAADWNLSAEELEKIRAAVFV
ncbi:MAG: aldo/keto reductase [Candidatus Omnitrophica bacterium]|nr:aldo/keto reductase [Candidatus Omnitrophota bacterium]